MDGWRGERVGAERTGDEMNGGGEREGKEWRAAEGAAGGYLCPPCRPLCSVSSISPRQSAAPGFPGTPGCPCLQVSWQSLLSPCRLQRQSRSHQILMAWVTGLERKEGERFSSPQPRTQPLPCSVRVRALDRRVRTGQDGSWEKTSHLTIEGHSLEGMWQVSSSYW